MTNDVNHPERVVDPVVGNRSVEVLVAGWDVVVGHGVAAGEGEDGSAVDHRDLEVAVVDASVVLSADQDEVPQGTVVIPAAADAMARRARD